MSSLEVNYLNRFKVWCNCVLQPIKKTYVESAYDAILIQMAKVRWPDDAFQLPSELEAIESTALFGMPGSFPV